MMRRLTRVLFGQTLRKLTFQENKINLKKRCEAREVSNAQVILVSGIRTCFKCHFSCTCTAQLDPDDQIHFVDSS